jgi:N-acylneuraminate cytidylyltransferase/CMP-N,N'-diacetyllegionaminic acid synthase
MKGVAFVPARGGSKRLRNKNIITLLGRPLIHHTLDTLAPIFDKIVIATDDDKITKIAEKHSCNPEIFMLPASTVTDKSTVLDSLTHAIIDRGMAAEYDYVGQFLPTCPLRSTEDIECAIAMLDKNIDGVISITDYDFPPTLGLCLDPDGLLHCSDHSLPWLTGNTRSQDHSGIYRPNGAVYLRWTDSFKKSPNFYKGRVRAYSMPKTRSLDIDTIEDVQLVEALYGTK